MIRNARVVGVLAAICALVTSSASSLAEWSMFHGDSRHSGVSSDLSVGAVAWTYMTSGTIEITSPAIGPDGTIYVANAAGELLALRNAGNLRWKLTGLGSISWSTPAIAPDGTIYVGASDSTLYAVNPSGTVRWMFRAAGAVKTSPNFGSDGTIYFGADDGKLYAVSPTNSLKWTYPTRDTIRSSPAIGPDGTIFFGSEDSSFYAINPNGTLRWQAATGAQIKYCSPAVSPSGVVYYGSYDNFVYARTSAGALVWAHNAQHVVRSSPAIGPDGTIFVGVDSNLVALNPIDGSQRWKRHTGGKIYSSPAYTGQDSNVVVGSDDGIVYAAHADSSAANYGHTAWTLTLGSSVRSSPAPDAAGDIVVCDMGGKVWALGPLVTVSVPVQAPAEGELRATPNPSTGEVWFQAGPAVPRLPLEIFDVRGRRVAVVTRSGHGYRWNAPGVERVSPGLYFYRLESRPAAGRLVILR